LPATNDSWTVDETFIEVKGDWKYLYQAVDWAGSTLDFLLTAKRNATVAKRVLCKALKAVHNQEPRAISVDTKAADPKAFGRCSSFSIIFILERIHNQATVFAQKCNC
jgi:transposase-like protein